MEKQTPCGSVSSSEHTPLSFAAQREQNSCTSRDSCTSGTSENIEKSSGLFINPDTAELMTLADLAGITAPEKVMKVLIELLAVGLTPTDCHQLLRTVISSRKQRSSSKQPKRHQSQPEKPPAPATPANI